MAVDEYIQQRSISTERVVDPYLLSTRAITTSNDAIGNSIKRSRVETRKELDLNGRNGGKKANKKSINQLTKSAARTAFSISCRMNHVSKLSQVRGC